jgi:hypothetical protein
MKAKLTITALALMLGFAPQLFHSAIAKPNLGQRYNAVLVAPREGEVLVPGQVYRIQWRSVLPDIDPSLCETELRLSLDGGKSFTWITGERDPLTRYFDWTVPPTPTNKAVLDIHFGCLGYYPETTSLQTQHSFVISSIKK